MGIFNKLLGGKKKHNSLNSNHQELRQEYNVMTNISLYTSPKHENKEIYEFVENGIYLDMNDEDDAGYRMCISYKLEDTPDNNNQYPLEDILDKYSLYVSDFLESENDLNSVVFKLELGGELDDIKKAQEILSKKVYNQDVLDNEGEVRVTLVIK